MGTGSYTQDLVNRLINPNLFPKQAAPTQKKSGSIFDTAEAEKKIADTYWGADGKFHIIYTDGSYAVSDAPPPAPKATGGVGGGDVGPISAGLRQQEIDQRWAELQQKYDLTLQELLQDKAQFATQRQYLNEKLRIDTDANNRAEIRATQQLMEQVQARIEANQLAQQRVISEAQQLQASMDFQAAQANARNQMDAAQFNESARQANLSQQRGVAQDIASFSGNPGDVGRNAAYLMAGSSAPISRAIATGQDARTAESLMPLDLLLRSRDELAKGITPFMPQNILAPRVPIPTFQPSQGMLQGGIGLPPGAPRPGLPIAPQPVPLPGAPPASADQGGFVDPGSDQYVNDGWFAPGAEQQALFTQDKEPGGSYGIQEALEMLQREASGGAVRAANGFFGTVSKPTLFMAGEAGPETVNVTPQSRRPQGITPSWGTPPLPQFGIERVTAPPRFDEGIAPHGFGTPPLLQSRPGGSPQPIQTAQYSGIQSAPASGPPQAVQTAQYSSQPSASLDFLNQAFRRALGNSPWAKAGTPTPVGVSAPGTNPFLQEMAAALAAIGQGINPSLFLREAQMAAPVGLSGAPGRRTR